MQILEGVEWLISQLDYNGPKQQLRGTASSPLFAQKWNISGTDQQNKDLFKPVKSTPKNA